MKDHDPQDEAPDIDGNRASRLCDCVDSVVENTRLTRPMTPDERYQAILFAKRLGYFKEVKK